MAKSSFDMQGDCGAATRCLFCSFAHVASLHLHCPALLQPITTPHLAGRHISEELRGGGRKGRGGEEEEEAEKDTSQTEGIKAEGQEGDHESVQSVLEANDRNAAGNPSSNPSSLPHGSPSTFYTSQRHKDPSNNLKLSMPCFSGDRAFTYSEVLACVNALSVRLQKALLGPCENESPHVFGDSVLLNPVKKVGILISPSVEYVVAVLAVLKCGFAFVPLEPFWPAPRITDVMADASLCILLTSRRTTDANVATKCNSFTLPILFVDVSSPLASNHSPNQIAFSHCMCFCHSDQAERPYCYLLYTSGSSGKPKGVYGTEMGLLHRLQWMQREYPFLECDVALFKSSIAFVDHLTELLGPLLGGSLVIVPPARDLYRNPPGLLPFMQAYYVTRLTAVPSLMRSLLPIISMNPNMHALMSVKVLVLSGERLSYDLVKSIQALLPHTTILNLYGCTELSGDCLCFNCGSLEKTQDNISVPIGKPLPGCLIQILSEKSVEGDEGELWVGGVLVALGYHRNQSSTKDKFMRLLGDEARNGKSYFFRTGDFVKKLKDGNLLFLGRKDRIIKVNGQKIALDEIESVLEKHPLVVQAAVSFRKAASSDSIIVAYVVFFKRQETREVSEPSQGVAYTSSVEDLEMLSCLKSWLDERLPVAMIPSQFTFLNFLPMVSAGKKDYHALDMLDARRLGMAFVDPSEPDVSSLAEDIRKAFQHVLKVDNISIYDDFFFLGGTSVSAAHVAYILDIDIRLLYSHSSAVKLEPFLRALQEEAIGSSASEVDEGLSNSRAPKRMKVNEPLNTSQLVAFSYHDKESSVNLGSNLCLEENWPHGNTAGPPLAFFRCNVFAPLNPCSILPAARQVRTAFLDSVSTSKSSKLLILWKTELKACVDASPVLVRYTTNTWRLFIGSHAHTFTCLDACSGNVIWERVLGDRVESTAALTSDFKQVVVGSYDGNVYFLESETGIVNWKFKTKAEVKCQPTVGIREGLVWCGSHDHHLYVLDAADQKCVWEYDCKGSVFAAAAHDLARCLTYVATTGGTVIAFSTESSLPQVTWVHVCEAPVFGSLALDAGSGYIICTLVNGCALALMSTGSVAWKYATGGPVFAGATLSAILPLQVLICSRDGWVYSLHLSEGRCLWKYCLDEPITSSAYVDEGLDLVFRESHGDRASLHSFRLVCACGSSGKVHVLKVYVGSTSSTNSSCSTSVKAGRKQVQFINEGRNDVTTVKEGEVSYVEGKNERKAETAACASDDKMFEVDNGCELLAVIKLPGDVFSSPVVLGGRIFVGCRDNYLYCLELSDLGF